MYISWHFLENSWNHIKWTYFLARCSHLEPQCERELRQASSLRQIRPAQSPEPMKLEEKLEFVESTPRIWETWFYSLHSTPSFHSSSTRKRSKVFESLRLLWILAEILRTSSWCSERNRVSCETVEISCPSNCNVCLWCVLMWNLLNF